MVKVFTCAKIIRKVLPTMLATQNEKKREGSTKIPLNKFHNTMGKKDGKPKTLEQQ